MSTRLPSKPFEATRKLSVRVSWKELLTEKESRPYIDRANELFKQLIADHPGTPWAARAEHEMKRGYGVDLYPEYDFPIPPYTGPLIPIPKL